MRTRYGLQANHQNENSFTRIFPMRNFMILNGRMHLTIVEPAASTKLRRPRYASSCCENRNTLMVARPVRPLTTKRRFHVGGRQ